MPRTYVAAATDLGICRDEVLKTQDGPVWAWKSRPDLGSTSGLYPQEAAVGDEPPYAGQPDLDIELVPAEVVDTLLRFDRRQQELRQRQGPDPARMGQHV